MGETEVYGNQTVVEEKREQIIGIVEEAVAEKVEELKQKDPGYPADGHAIVAYFAACDTYERRNGRYVLKSTIEDEKRDF